MSDLEDFLFTPVVTEGFDDAPIYARKGLWIRLVNQDTAAESISTEASTSSGAFSVAVRPDPGVYDYYTGKSGTGPWTKIGTYNVPPDAATVNAKANDNAVVHLAGQEFVSGQKDMDTVHTLAPWTSADSAAFGTSGTDAAFQSGLAQIASGGVLVLTPGVTYNVSKIPAISNARIIAYGATIVHTGSSWATPPAGMPTPYNPLVSVVGVQNFHTLGGSWWAKQSTSDPTTAVFFVSGSFPGNRIIEPVIEGGDGIGNRANRYGAYGIWLYGRQNHGVYYDAIRYPFVKGCSVAGLYVDGWDATAGETYCNGLDVYGGVFQENGPYPGTRDANNQMAGAGVWIEGGNINFWGGDVEHNQGPAFHMGAHAIRCKIRPGWIENNNNGAESAPTSAYPQFYTDPTAAGAYTASSSFDGVADHVPGGNPTDTNPGGTNNIAYWAEWNNGTDHYVPGSVTFINAPYFQRASTGLAAIIAGTAGDAFPRWQVSGAGAISAGPGTAIADATILRTRAATYGTNSSTDFQIGRKFWPSNFGTTQIAGGIYEAPLGTTLPTSAQGATGDICINSSNPGGFAVAVRTSSGWAWDKPGSGATSGRPSPSAVGAGFQWFDSTLVKPIWSTGSAWVDATGASV